MARKKKARVGAPASDRKKLNALLARLRELIRLAQKARGPKRKAAIARCRAQLEKVEALSRRLMGPDGIKARAALRDARRSLAAIDKRAGKSPEKMKDEDIVEMSLDDLVVPGSYGSGMGGMASAAKSVSVSVPRDEGRMGKKDMAPEGGVRRMMRATPAASAPAEERVSTSKPTIVPVFWATDRGLDTQAPSDRADFLNGRGRGELLYGLADVSIPPEHCRGMVERPASILTFELREDPGKHVVISGCQVRDKGDWERLVAAHLRSYAEPAALVFVHGFNVSFADAVRRAGQIGFDIAFKGVVAAYSWCSEYAIKGYPADEENVRLTVKHLREFFCQLNELGAKRVHVISHSMGNRAVVEALRSYSRQGGGLWAAVGQVIMAAPDIDADLLRQSLGELKDKAQRYTLYGSAQDRALVVSKNVHGGYPRAGDGAENLFVAEGIETVDASAVGGDLLGLGHSYFAAKRPVLDDIFYVIQKGLPASERAGLLARARGQLPYWEFQRG